MTTAVAVTTAAPAPVAFDYDAEKPDDAKVLQRIARSIRKAEKEAMKATYAIGAQLLQARSHFTHGTFERWVEFELPFTVRTARNYMAVAERLAGKSEVISGLAPTTVYKLAAPSTPPAVREAIVKRLEAGEKVRDAEIIKEVKTATAAAKPKPIAATTSTAATFSASAGTTAPVIPPDDEIAAEAFVRDLHAWAGVRFGEMMDFLDRAGGLSPAIRKARSKIAAAVAPVAAPASDETPSVEEIADALSDAGEAEATRAKAADEASDEPETVEIVAEEARPVAEAEPEVSDDEDDEQPEDDVIEELDLGEYEETRAAA